MSNKDTSQGSFTHKLQKVFSIAPQDRSEFHLNEIMAVTAEIAFLKKITEEKGSDHVHWECCRAMTLEIFEKGQNVVNIGDIGDKFYIIIQGKVSILVPLKSKKTVDTDKSQKIQRTNTFSSKINENSQRNRIMRKSTLIDFSEKACEDTYELVEVRVLNSGDSFGELALLNNNPRSATVKCLTECYFAVLTQKEYKKILRIDAERAVKERVSLLKKLPIFSNLTELNLKSLGYALTESTFKKNQVVYTESDPVDYIYIIKSGEFKLSIKEKLPIVRHQSTSSLLKLKLMKTSQRKVDLDLVVKGKNEIFGYEEYNSSCANRKSTCTCISLYGKVLVANINDLKNRQGCQEILSALKNQKTQEISKNRDRLKTLRNVEKLKLPLSSNSLHLNSSQNIHNLLYEMGKRHRPAFVVNDEYVESASLSPKKEETQRIETESVLKSESSIGSYNIKRFNSQDLKYTPRILTKTKEISMNHEGFLKNILKKGGIGGVFRDSFNDFCTIGIHPCLTTRAKNDFVGHRIFSDN